VGAGAGPRAPAPLVRRSGECCSTVYSGVASDAAVSSVAHLTDSPETLAIWKMRWQGCQAFPQAPPSRRRRSAEPPWVL
jgi:hypothetical protein